MASLPAAPDRLVIATRRSALAIWQAEHVRTRLSSLLPASAIELLGLTTQGDRYVEQPLQDIGGKGLFIKELEQAMLEGRADLAVHSLKDVPMDMPEGFVLAAIMAREDPRDAFVSNRHRSLSDLPSGSRVGTSSLRREAQLRERYPKLSVEPLRGNVDTRLRKLDEGRYAALECRADRVDVGTLLAAISDSATTLAVVAERAFGKRLGGDCHTPLAAYATSHGDDLWLRGLIASRDGRQVLRGELSASVTSVAAARALGDTLGADFLKRGAAQLLASSLHARHGRPPALRARSRCSGASRLSFPPSSSFRRKTRPASSAHSKRSRVMTTPSSSAPMRSSTV
jgi:hydroxymethylbilane synthase